MVSIVNPPGSYTQGDAFEVAFTKVYSCVSFALWVQEQLMNQAWSKRVLQMEEFR